jgi:RNA-directed DNA polymerase
LPTIIADINRTLRGWFEYFKHSHRRTFKLMDGWVRRRLRSLLRKRLGRRGIAKVHAFPGTSIWCPSDAALDPAILSEQS